MNICGILDGMLEKPPSLEGTDYVFSDISDMAHVLPAVESVLVPDFFAHLTNISPTPENAGRTSDQPDYRRLRSLDQGIRC